MLHCRNERFPSGKQGEHEQWQEVPVQQILHLVWGEVGQKDAETNPDRSR